MAGFTDSKLFRAICENLCDGAEYEHRFHPRRKWRFDVAWPDMMIAVEIDGGTWIQGRHSRGAGQSKDNEKINAAQSLGWKVYRFTPTDVKRGVFVRAMGAIFAGNDYPCELDRKKEA